MIAHSRGSDWRSILLLIFSLSGTALAITAAFGMLFLMAINEPALVEAAPSPLATILTASTMTATGLLLLPIAWLSWKRLQGQQPKPLNLPAPRFWTWIVLPGFWVLVIVLASLFYDAPGSSWYAPFLHFLSIALPTYLVVRFSVNNIPLGSRRRAWTVFGSGMTLSPVFAVLAEVIVIIFGLVVVGVYLTLNPDLMFEFQRLVNQIQGAPDLDSVMLLVGPYLKNPLTLFAALTFLSMFVPVIEETCKSLGVWLVADRLSSPAQGFAIGVLSGAGFALAESLFASVTADNTWGLTLAMRAISGTMHMLAAGLFGWGIAKVRLEKDYVRSFGTILLAILLHSAWNAGVVFSIAGGASVVLSAPEMDLFGSLIMLAGVGLVFLLMTGMYIALFLINRRLRTPQPTPTQPATTLPLPSHPLEEEGNGESG